jgi:hypothetical protein
MKGTLHEDQNTFVMISPLILLRMKTDLDKSRRENKNTHCVFTNFFFENHAVYEKMWKYNV